MCSAHVQTMSSVVTRLEHTVYGNGKEGLITIAARTDEKLTGVIESMNELPETLKEQIEGALAGALVQMEAKREEKKSAPDTAWQWFTDKILPYFVTGVVVIVLQALWELAKIRFATP